MWTQKCTVCDQKVVDSEGPCKGWFHRYCAGVSLSHFESVSMSSTPFHCVACFQKNYNTELADLRNTVSVLREEVNQLRTTLETKCMDCAQAPTLCLYSAVAANDQERTCRICRNGGGGGAGGRGRGDGGRAGSKGQGGRGRAGSKGRDGRGRAGSKSRGRGSGIGGRGVGGDDENNMGLWGVW